MKFVLIDRVLDFEPSRSLRAVKAVSLSEEYLADHFPRFPVLPGVFIIEALVQAAAMLVHLTQEFAHSIAVLESVRNVKYKSFVKPGNLLELQVKVKSLEPAGSSFQGTGQVGDREMVQARFTLRHYNLAQRNAGLADVDNRIKQELQTRARILGALPAA